jgi:hypothetical protein
MAASKFGRKRQIPLSPVLRLLFLGAITWRDALFLGVLLGRCLEQGVDQSLVTLDPTGDWNPLGTISLLDFDLA